MRGVNKIRVHGDDYTRCAVMVCMVMVVCMVVVCMVMVVCMVVVCMVMAYMAVVVVCR